MTDPNQRTRDGNLRLAVAYGALVVVPAVIAIVLLSRGGETTATLRAEKAGFPLITLLIAVSVVVVACKLSGMLMQRIGQPPVTGEIVAGIVLGPSVLGAFWPAGASAVLPASIVPNLNVLAQVGVVLFLMLAGLEINTALLRGRGKVALLVSHVSIAFPSMLGVGVAVFAYTEFAPEGIGFLAFALFFGVSLSITALPVLVRILQDIGMFGSKVGVLALTCALVDDVTAWTLLAIVVALVTASSLGGVAVTIGLTAVFVALLFFVVKPLLARMVTRFTVPTLNRIAPLMIVATLLAAAATEWIGVHAMFGAFLFGVIIPRDNPVADWLHDKVGGLTTALMLPLFFAFSGLRTNIRLLSDLTDWLWCIGILAVAIIGKFGGATIAALAAGETSNRSLQIGSLMNCRGLTELIVLNIGLDLGVLSPKLFTMLVLMALVSTAMAAPLTTYLARRAGDHPITNDYSSADTIKKRVDAG